MNPTTQPETTAIPATALDTEFTRGLGLYDSTMIAAAGLRKFRAGMTSSFDLNADAALPLGN